MRLRDFFATEVASGVILLLSTVVALALANSAWSESYFHLLHLNIAGLSLHHWINDGLMTIFFFVVGMEIKRELMVGELSTPKKAALPIAGALGGMIGPALLYLWLNPNYPESRGWGIPMATDIAFAVGVLSFFSRRVPLALKIFLLALAIVDDLGAVLVIAFFYTKEIAGPYLGVAALVLGAMVLAKRAGVRAYGLYVLLGAGVWFAVLKSGVHATVAGVLVGLLTPLEFPKEKGEADTYSPLQQLVHHLHPWVSFGIMPVFALANAGVVLGGGEAVATSSIFQGVTLGLLLGKPVGILLFCVLAVSLGLAELPRGVSWGAKAGVACLGGIGFTMALFISSLALYPEQEVFSKAAILAASLASAAVGSLLLGIFLPKKIAPGRWLRGAKFTRR